MLETCVEVYTMPIKYREKPHLAKPRLKRSPKMSLVRLLRSSHSSDKKTAQDVKVMRMESPRLPKGMEGWQFRKGTTLTKGSSHQHIVRIYWQGEEEPLTLRTKIVVDCTCSRHKYFYEYANAQVGASFIYRSNGEAPDTTNPGYKPGTCKHIFKTVSILVNRMKGQNKRRKSERDEKKTRKPVRRRTRKTVANSALEKRFPFLNAV